MSENSYPKAESFLTENFEASSYIEDEFFKGVEPDKISFRARAMANNSHALFAGDYGLPVA